MSSTNPYEAPTALPPQLDVQERARRDANWALALAIVSVLLCAPVTAPFAIWLAIRAGRTNSSGKAIAAVILAAFGLASSAFLWFLAIWQFLTPAGSR